MAINLLSAVAVPKIVFQQVNRMISTFFWGTHEGKPKRKWVSWNTICRLMSEGGLGIRNVEEVVSSFRLKGLWNAMTNKSIWSSFICGKYGINNKVISGYVPPCSALKFWKECANLTAALVKNSTWKVGQGDMNFWFENWSKEGILAEVHTEALTICHITLRETVEVDFSINGLSETLISHVKDLYNTRLSAESNVRLWARNPNGTFTVKPAFD
ncbi:hypothetical protein BVC80_7669g2 [Macleaya cordata]|uniref:Reverse transcriptase zinc-binding domain n=1 Tax=Macleaya cordata TaxID=56857 RepID=A0A200R1F1_MACCD|nr:hypothetical protein BVC80_7669g2 [Macleaya cordata]